MNERFQTFLAIAVTVFVIWLVVHLKNDRQHARADIVHDLCQPHGGYKENLMDPEALSQDEFFHVLCADGTAIEGAFDDPELASKYNYDET